MIQIGDLVRINNLIGIVTCVDSDIVIARCHDGIAHTAKPEDAELLVSSCDILKQFEEAICSYDYKH